jgi:hypothetical protein
MKTDVFMKYIKYLFLSLLALFVVHLVTNKYIVSEGFASLSPGDYPKSADRAILDDYPQKGINETSNNNYSDIWWHYPVFKLGSFEQITNNLKYNYNPDNGTCIRADFCGAIYDDIKDKKSNIIKPLPEAQEGGGARVGYFRTEPNKLYFSIPTNENILY